MGIQFVIMPFFVNVNKKAIICIGNKHTNELSAAAAAEPPAAEPAQAAAIIKCMYFIAAACAGGIMGKSGA
jgi:hypothetical protein